MVLGKFQGSAKIQIVGLIFLSGDARLLFLLALFFSSRFVASLFLTLLLFLLLAKCGA